MAVDEPDLLTRYETYVNPGLARAFRFMGLSAVEHRGRGATVWDEDGVEYLDLSSGYGVISHGHLHPRIVARAHEQLQRLGMSTRLLLNRPLIEVAQLLAELTPGDLQYTFMVNSGTEAVEAAIKFARAATGRTRLVTTAGAFHGKTLGALSVSGRDLYQNPFRPLLPDVTRVPYGDLAAMEAAVDADTAAVIVEPIQGEGGVIIPPDGYLPGLRALCDRTGALLIADEVQTGIARTGRLFAVEHWNVAPDLMTLAKALGGGIVAVGAVVGTARAFSFFDSAPLIHTSTFGGNELAAAVAAESLQVAVDEELAQQAAEKGAYLLPRLQAVAAEYPGVIREVRGKGLLIGIEGTHPGVGGALMAELFERHVLVIHTLNNEHVIRLLPPLTIDGDQLSRAVDEVGAAIRTVAEMGLEE
jgi:putrescine aminotransferase